MALALGRAWEGRACYRKAPSTSSARSGQTGSPPCPGQCHPNLLFPPLLKCPYTVDGCWFTATTVLDGVFCWIRYIGPRCAVRHLSFIKCDEALFFCTLRITVILRCLTPVFDSCIALVNEARLRCTRTFAMARSAAARSLTQASQGHTIPVLRSPRAASSPAPGSHFKC